MAELIFTGPFKKEMQNFIALKRCVGYKYNTEPGILKRFDTYLAVEYPKADILSKEAVTGWCAGTMHETAANHCSRASVIRQFSKYLDSIGIHAWILPKNYYPSGQPYVPHIYTPEELRRFFEETDKCCYCSEVPYRHLVMPEFFRLLLSCGLRCSEARLLTGGDVDLGHGVLTIRDSKNHNSRLVPMPVSMTRRLREYAGLVHPFLFSSSFNLLQKPESYRAVSSLSIREKSVLADSPLFYLFVSFICCNQSSILQHQLRWRIFPGS